MSSLKFLILLSLGVMCTTLVLVVSSVPIEPKEKSPEATSPEKVTDAEVEAPGAEEDEDGVGSRFNLNLNRQHAFAQGPGGYGGSDAVTHGFEAGIRGPGGYRVPLHRGSGGYGSSYQAGYRPPQTWANGYNNMGNGRFGGGGSAGYRGGIGHATSDSLTKNFEIPIGPGTVFYSNLNTEGEDKEASGAEVTPLAAKGQDPAPAPVPPTLIAEENNQIP